MRIARARYLLAATLAAVWVAACGDDGEGGGRANPTHTPVPTFTPRPTATVPSGIVVISEPAPGSVVASFSFAVVVELTAGPFEPDTLTVTLNDAPLALSGGPTRFTASVNPGAPLRDDNTLVANAQTLGGQTVSATSDFRYLPPKARAHRITGEAELLRGPLAHGRVGDYLLGNSVARFVIQDAPHRDLYSVGAFGGNIIDAELVERPGRDNFLEIQPAINIETVVNAQMVEIVNDGQDGTAAIVRTCGPDDVLDFVNPSTIIEDQRIDFPDSADDRDYDIEACTDYVLEPGKTYVQMITTIVNNEDEERGFFVGDYLNGSGELEQWTSTADAGMGEILVTPDPIGVMSFIGYGEATGVDYAHVTVPVPDSRIQSSASFTTSGVSYVLHSHSILVALLTDPRPTFVVPANGSKSYTRFFGVGDGSGGNAIAIENEVKGIATGVLRGCVTVGGAPAVAARVSVGPQEDGTIAQLASQFVTDAAGCYEGPLPPGEYGVAAAQRGVPYEGMGTTPLVHPVTIAVGQPTVQDIALPATGRVRVTVTDQTGAAVPARISVVGFDPSPEPILRVASGVGTTSTGIFRDPTDSIGFGLAHLDYAGATGVVEFDMEPGTYQLFVSRGTEYSTFDVPLTVTAGETTPVNARIARVVDTAGFISSDFHVHGINSADSRVSHRDRAFQFAGEGVDNIIMTDHHAHTDLKPTIAALGLTDFVSATISEEITTWDYGHFNAYPLTIDPTRPSGGSTDWGRAAPAGRDFTAYGAYGLTPAEIAALATEGPQSTPDTIIQINHINSHFDPLQIDTSIVPPASFISAENKRRFRLDPATGNLFHHFPALELWNGAGRGKQAEFLVDRIGIWFNHLNQGLVTTAIADTDTHQFLNLNTAGARTWTAATSDDPAAVDPAEVARSVAAGRAVGGQGLYVQARLVSADGVADLTLGGSTIVTAADRAVDLEIIVQAPVWAEYDRIEIYANAATTVTKRNRGVPVLFSAEPTLVLVKDTDFSVERIPVFPEVAGAERLQTMVRVPFTALAGDTWFVVVVKGTDGTSRPMFPVFTHDLARGSNRTLAELIDGNLGEGGVLALAYTNALYADVDGEPGFQPPLGE
jgi:hypothetical protein